jgi:hypothetical protein
MSILRVGAALFLMSVGLSACASAPGPASQAPSSGSSGGGGGGVAQLTREAEAARPLVKSRWGREFLDVSARLPSIPPRRLGNESIDEVAYYYGESESPIFFAHLLDLLGQNDTRHLVGRHVLDLRLSAIGPLLMLAAAGADVVGVNSSARLQSLYGLSGDQGTVPLLGREVSGHLSLVSGQFPTDPATRSAVGGSYDAILVKNLLKRGYIHPTEALPNRAVDTRVDLGMPDDDYLRLLLALLRPGGRLLVYNLGPASSASAEQYNPHADCRNPFPQAIWQAVGFRVLDYDRSDTAAVEEFGPALHLGRDLFATYTLAERL